MNYYLGVDLGSSSLKIIVGDEKGGILGSESSAYAIVSEHTGYSEQDPQLWIDAFETTFAKLLDKYSDLKSSIRAISFSGQMHSLVLLDNDGKPLRNAILWNDTRTTAEVRELNEQAKAHLLKHEKNIALEGFTLPKIRWVQKHEPELWDKTWKFVLPKDYLVYYLTGKLHTEPSDAAGTILYDLEAGEWDKNLLQQWEIPIEKCPDVIPSTAVAGNLKAALKQKFKLANDIRIIMGGADNACGALGTIADFDQQGLISVGTSGVVLFYDTETHTQVDGRFHYFHSALEGMNYKMGVTLSAGYSLDWLKQIMAPTESFETFTKTAEESPIGSNGVIFVPYLFGERSPYYNADLSASFTNLKAHHKRADLIRSVLEGIAFSLKNVFLNMETPALPKFRIIGGVVKNPFWLQMFADVFGSEIEVLELDEGPAFGAMICAVLSESRLDAKSVLEKYNRVKRSYFPDNERSKQYDVYFEQFKTWSDQLDS